MHHALWGWGILGMLLWLTITIIAVVVINHIFRHQPDANNHNTPLEIAKTRYAKGEISQKEYAQFKRDLS